MVGRTLRIEVWCDFVCPFCYLELPLLKRLQRERGQKVSVTWRAYELRPGPIPTLDPDGEYLHRVWNQSVYPITRERGMALKLPPVQPRSRKAHEATAFAGKHGRPDAMLEELFRAFFEQGRNIGDVAVLQEVGASVGLDSSELGEALGAGRYTPRVLEDQRIAQEIGITGVPATLLHDGSGEGQGMLLSGAVPYASLEAGAERALRYADI